MTIFVLFSLLVGAVLAMGFTFVVLLPATAVMVALVAFLGLFQSDGMTLQTCLAVTVALQTGYFAGLVTLLLLTPRRGRTQTAQAKGDKTAIKAA